LIVLSILQIADSDLGGQRWGLRLHSSEIPGTAVVADIRIILRIPRSKLSWKVIWHHPWLLVIFFSTDNKSFERYFKIYLGTHFHKIIAGNHCCFSSVILSGWRLTWHTLKVYICKNEARKYVNIKLLNNLHKILLILHIILFNGKNSFPLQCTLMNESICLHRCIWIYCIHVILERFNHVLRVNKIFRSVILLISMYLN
jgi:hypothetical protein